MGLAVTLNIVTYLLYRAAYIRHATSQGLDHDQALADFEQEFPSYRD